MQAAFTNVSSQLVSLRRLLQINRHSIGRPPNQSEVGIHSPSRDVPNVSASFAGCCPELLLLQPVVVVLTPQSLLLFDSEDYLST
ncbi:hypothetical protein BaRGS_00038251 [Batillaria attramentaria]|uniref:Uncharacterized protein n=1 Tax=Batillaria attramentaria TaxID=370345 RepID=A0ABD0J6Y9_9CAEN